MFTKNDHSINQALDIVIQSNERGFVILNNYAGSVSLLKPVFFDNIGEVLSGSNKRWHRSYNVTAEEYFLEVLSENSYEIKDLELTDNVKVKIGDNCLPPTEAIKKFSYFEPKECRCYAEFNMSIENIQKGFRYISPKWNGKAILDPNRVEFFKDMLKQHLIAIHFDVLNKDTNEWNRVLTRNLQETHNNQACVNPCLIL